MIVNVTDALVYSDGTGLVLKADREGKALIE
jgi:hypothetical protein